MAAARKSKNKITLEGNADPRAPLDSAQLLATLQPVLKALEVDLLERARASTAVDRALRARHENEVAQKRTADAYDGWLRQFVVQVAAAWVLSCVFVRTLEDRGFLGHARIAGPGALDSERQFSDLAPSLNERDYLLTVFRELTRFPVTEALFDAAHNPVWLLGPSKPVAKLLLDAFRSPSADAPALRFGQPDTRFLGDIYQDLSADVRERFALLQTPNFVEEFILDRTLEPAIAEFGIEQANVIDPTCGSGHFLLGAFARLVEHRRRAQPGVDIRQHAIASLNAIAGIDLNPYAIAIARFRLTLAALETCGYRRLDGAPSFPLNLVVGDSLLHRLGVGQASLGDVATTEAQRWKGDEYALVDDAAAKRVLTTRYAAVVGNPPYITVTDPVLRERYRNAYPRSAAGKYSLGAPFTERFFDLARNGGFVGLITANSFMKREFGKKLIESFLKTVDLTAVVNTSGAYIPGHGTPTVILFGRSRPSTDATVRAVLAKRGEPATPDDPAEGLVWRSIVTHIGDAGHDDEFVTVADVARRAFDRHPWSLGGGGANELKESLERNAAQALSTVAAAVGVGGMSNADDVYIAASGAWTRYGMPPHLVRPLVIGEDVRDWMHSASVEVFFPYDSNLELVAPTGRALELLWPYRTLLWSRAVFGGGTYRSSGRSWWEWHQVTADRYRTSLSITFAEVATHNHFLLDRGGKVFKQTAPIIKLPAATPEDDHLALTAFLNSSTACFWMKQVAQPKSNHSEERPEKGIPDWERFAFASSVVSKMPLPTPRDLRSLVSLAREMDAVASARAANEVASWIDKAREGGRIRERIDAATARDTELESRMVAVQEDIDWAVYRAFGLTQLSDSFSQSARLRPAERPFLCNDPPPLEEADRRIWLARKAAIAASPEIALIETLVNKRKWMGGARGSFALRATTFVDRARDAAASAILDIAEEALKANRTPANVRELARASEPLVSSELFSVVLDGGSREVILASIVAAESVPFLATLRHTESGLEKRAVWEATWDLQRREDAGEHVGSIPAAPRYDSTDYRESRYFQLRGKLDVPKERFISYPGCESDEDNQPVYGWAGWNHLEQAIALATLYQTRKTAEGWGKDRLTPMLAGILELLPWVKQWHTEPSDEYGGETPGAYLEGFLDGECATLGLTRDDLRNWRPPQKSRGRPGKAEARGDEPKKKNRAARKKTATEDEATE